jgi:hypothetical protein
MRILVASFIPICLVSTAEARSLQAADLYAQAILRGQGEVLQAIGILAAPSSSCSVNGHESQLNRARNVQSDFCKDPYEAICSNAETTLSAIESRLELLRSQGTDVGSTIAKSLGPFKDDIKKLTVSAISDLHLSATEKNTLVQRVEQVQLFTDYEFYNSIIRVKDPETGGFKKSSLNAGQLSHTCQGYWDARNSASGWLDDMKKIPAVVLCDGFLLGAIGGGTEADRSFRLAAPVAGHEIGHELNRFTNVTQQYLECIHTYYPDQDTLKQLTELKKDDDTSVLFSTHREELAADFWANQIAVEYLKSKPELTQGERLEALQEMFGPFCGLPGGIMHPSPRYRIESLRWNPEIHRLMGCVAPQKGRPGCDASGRTQNPLF